jgi:stress response protein YsnF
MDDNEKDLVVPVISEELHADAVPVVTGGVRVTKRVHTHDEVLEQQLRKTHADIKRVKINRVVDGPQAVQHVGNTTVIPIVSEELHIEKRWVLTEEIHITQTEETETVQQTVPVSHEEAAIERLDESGNTVSSIDAESEAAANSSPAPRGRPASIVERARSEDTRATKPRTPRSLIRNKASGPAS